MLRTIQNSINNSRGKVIPMPCTIALLSAVYNENRKTMYNCLLLFKNEIGVRITNYNNYHQVEIIYEKLGEPESFEFYKCSV
jgi:hypothetical protein